MYQDDKVVIELDGETFFDPDDLKKCYNDFVNKETITGRIISITCSLMVKKANYIIMTPLHRRYIIFSLELLLPPRPAIDLNDPSRMFRVGCLPHRPTATACIRRHPRP